VALASNGAEVGGVATGSQFLLDGDVHYSGSTGYAESPWPCEWVVTLKRVYRLQQIRMLLWGELADNRRYRYSIAVSADGKKFDTIVNQAQGSNWQDMRFPPRPVKAIKILGLWNNVNKGFQVVEFEAYCLPVEHAHKP
jgi:hypothetical protein